MSTTKHQPNPDTAWYEGLQRLVSQAQDGDTTALPALRRLLAERPEVWREAGDLARRAEDALLDLADPEHLAIRECIKLRLDELRDELGAASAPPLERLLIDRVTLCWLHVGVLELALVELQRQRRQATPEAKEAQKRLDGAHRRLLSSVKTLATVRKLLRPAVSPLDLVGKPVAETPGDGGRLGQRRAGLPACN